MVKFYVGEMSSYKLNLGRGEEEVLVLERLDCVLSAETDKAVECLDEALRSGYRDFTRSDNLVRTLVDISVLAGDVK